MSNKRKVEIETHLKCNDKRYSFFTPHTVRSNVWKHFQVVKFLDTVENFARCNHCKEILSYSPKSGTGSLLRHRCVRSQFTRIPKEIPTPQSVANFIQSMLPQKVNEEIVKLQLGFITEDLRPLNITEGNGFKKFAQALINIGADYGKQNIEDILVSRPILLNSAIPAEYFNIKNQLEYALTSNHIAFSTNILVDESSQRSFLTLTSHYINDEFHLSSNLLGTREFIQNREASESIHYFVSDILSEFQIKDKLSHGVIVTQNSEEFISAFRCYKRISCSCHNIELFMKNVLEKNCTKEIRELVDASKRLVTFFENSELSNVLIDPLKQNSNAKNNLFAMLSCIFTMYNEIEQALMERNEWQEIAGINFNLLEDLLSFFSIVNECSETMKSHSVPTISQYCLWYEKMLRRCVHNPKDSEVITELKIRAKIALEQQLQPDIIHYVALFLNPPYKNMEFLSTDRRSCVITAVKTLLKDLKVQQDKDMNCMLQTGDTEVDPIASSPPCNILIDTFQELKDNNGNETVLNSEVEEEFQKYLKMNVRECNILEFWKNAQDLPLLRSIAKQILNIPASCMDKERSSLMLGGILSGNEVKLSNESVDQILFLNKNNNGKNKLLKNEKYFQDI